MTPALIVSIIALAVALASLSWQINSWRRSGPVVSVSTSNAFPTYGDRIGAHHAAVTVRNTGRAPVQVTRWSLAAPGGRKLVDLAPLNFSTPLPHTLANGAEASFYLPMTVVRQQCAELGIEVNDLRAQVSLGTGDVVSAPHRGIGHA